MSFIQAFIRTQMADLRIVGHISIPVSSIKEQSGNLRAGGINQADRGKLLKGTPGYEDRVLCEAPGEMAQIFNGGTTNG